MANKPLIFDGAAKAVREAGQNDTITLAGVSPVTANAAAEVFLTAAGGETSAPLTIGGVPLAGSPTVTAIHRTDWQGRQLLYSTARTNLSINSQAIGSTGGWSNNSITITQNSAVAADGTTTAAKLQANSNVSAYTACPAFTVSAGANYATSVYLQYGSASQSRVALYNSGLNYNRAYVDLSWNTSTGVPTVITQSGVVATVITPMGSGIYRITIVGNSSTYTQLRTLIYPDRFSGTGYTYAWGLQNEVGTIATGYIPTTTAAVTVTDYTMSGNMVSLGQAASAGAVYDWDGSGTPRYPASFAGPVTVGQYLKASLPSASTYTYALIVVTDATGGPALCLSNGTNWINLTTGSVVS